MSATLTPNGSAVDFVKGLPPETKGEIIYSLFSELVSIRGSGPIPVTSPTGEYIGYFLPTSSAQEEFERFAETIPPGIREKMMEPYPADFDIDDCLTEQELQELRRSAQTQSP